MDADTVKSIDLPLICHPPGTANENCLDISLYPLYCTYIHKFSNKVCNNNNIEFLCLENSPNSCSN